MTDGTKDKAKGFGDQIAGKAKEVVGGATGDEDTEAEGKLQQDRGEVEKGIGDIKDKIGDKVGDLKKKLSGN